MPEMPTFRMYGYVANQKDKRSGQMSHFDKSTYFHDYLGWGALQTALLDTDSHAFHDV